MRRSLWVKEVFGMVNVIASIRVKEDQRADFITIFKSNIPAVLEEEGCIRYAPAVDIDADLPGQSLDENVVTVIEKWNTLEDLKAHLVAPHMLAFRERVEGMVEDVTLKVLESA